VATSAKSEFIITIHESKKDGQSEARDWGDSPRRCAITPLNMKMLKMINISMKMII